MKFDFYVCVIDTFIIVSSDMYILQIYTHWYKKTPVESRVLYSMSTHSIIHIYFTSSSYPWHLTWLAQWLLPQLWFIQLELTSLFFWGIAICVFSTWANTRLAFPIASCWGKATEIRGLGLPLRSCDHSPILLCVRLGASWSPGILGQCKGVPPFVSNLWGLLRLYL